jgi:uncharacterized protein (TIGR00304 family)
MQKLIALGMLLVFAGFVIIFIGIAGSVLRREAADESGSVRAGGVIFIGPVPLVFGTDKTMVLLSIAGAVLLLAAYAVWRGR